MSEILYIKYLMFDVKYTLNEKNENKILHNILYNSLISKILL